MRPTQTYRRPAPVPLVVAAGAFSVAAIQPVVVAVPLAILGALLCWVAIRGDELGSGVLGAAALVVVASAFGTLLADLARIPPITATELGLWVGMPAVLGMLALLRVRRGGHPPVIPLSWILVLSTVGIGLAVMVSNQGSSTGIDVYFTHREAARVLAASEDPYGESLVVFDGRPDALEGAEIVGYSYPPVTMFSYVAGHRVFGDSRWLNLLAWGAVLAMIAVGAIRRRDTTMFAVLLVATSFGAWRLIVYTGWTEPLTIVFLLVAGVFWQRSGPAAAIALGLALGSKQYMILLAPLLIVAAPRLGRTRTLGAIGVAAASVVPFLFLWRETMIEALVLRFLRAGYRADTLSVPALVEKFGGEPRHYLYLGVAGALASSWYAGRRATGYDMLMVGFALVLASFFLVTQALTNYWFLVGACCVLAAWGAARNPTADRLPASAATDEAR